MARNINELLKLINSNYKKNIKSMTIDELVKLLKKLSDAYYNTGNSLVADEIYDEIKEYLEKKDPNNAFLKEVGAPVKGTKEKVILPYEMGSLTKMKLDSGDVDKWIKKYKGPYVLSDKIDGVSAQLYKNNEGNVFLYSRGNGIEGQDISHLIKYFISKKSIELLPKNVSVRGELVISKKKFKKISHFMKNARNAVAGLVNSKTVDERVANVTDFVLYSILHPRYKYSEQLKILDGMKFNVVEYIIVKKINDQILEKYLKKRKEDSEYEMDGIVCVDNSDIYENVGEYPEYAFAFKMIFEDQLVIATVVDVLWNPSKDGYIKPRVQIKPVNLVGTTVTYATAHNAKFIVDNKIGPGSKIKIIRSGDVIPYILEVIKISTTGKPKMPSYDYEWNETKVDIILKNLNGKGGKIVTIKLLTHFFSKMGVKYLSSGIITKLVNDGYDSISKILTASMDDLLDIDGLGEKAITKIYDEIDRSFDEIDLVTFMVASNKFGRGLGERKLKEIIMSYPDILNSNWTKKEMIDKILQIHGFSDKTATLFVTNFQNFKKFYNEISKIKDISRFDDIKGQYDSTNNILDGQVIVFTEFRDKELEKLIVKNGGRVSGSVSSRTTILIHKDNPDKSSTKYKKAIELGITTISRTNFVKKFKLK